MSNIQIFENNMFGSIRTLLDENGEAWFYGVDVAKALGYKRPGDAVKDHVDEMECKSLNYKAFSKITNTNELWSNPNDFSNKVMINESGVYALILGSNLPSARDFKRWVTSEVLPSIRKHGAFVEAKTAEQWLNDPAFMIQTLQKLVEERKAKELAQAQLEVTKEELRGARIAAETNAKIASITHDSYKKASEALVEMKGIVIEKSNEIQDLQDYIDKMTNLGESMTAMDVGKFFNMSNRKVNELLHKYGYIFKRRMNWYPYADVDEPELFKMVLTRCPDGNFRRQLRFQPKILKIVNKLLLKEKGEK